MLLARFGVYGITIYGGYGEGNDERRAVRLVLRLRRRRRRRSAGRRRSSSPASAAASASTARSWCRPTSRSSASYPLIKALDPARHAGRPDGRARAARPVLPARARHVLVRRRAVVQQLRPRRRHRRRRGAGRRRARDQPARPGPHGAARARRRALVSIELALLVRFSISEGVLWVQGQLTDNSWLLYPDVRLTGGFAYVIVVQGPARAASSCSRWAATTPTSTATATRSCRGSACAGASATPSSIKGGSYFALTSEAVMAGGDFEASADFGPAWARAAVRRPRHRLLRPVPLRGQRLRRASAPGSRSTSTWLGSGTCGSRSRSTCTPTCSSPGRSFTGARRSTSTSPAPPSPSATTTTAPRRCSTGRASTTSTCAPMAPACSPRCPGAG